MTGLFVWDVVHLLTKKLMQRTQLFKLEPFEEALLLINSRNSTKKLFLKRIHSLNYGMMGGGHSEIGTGIFCF